MTSDENMVGLIHSGELVPRFEANQAAAKIYSEFTTSHDYAEDLSRLSFAARTEQDDTSIHRLLDVAIIDRLEKRHYITSLLGRLSTQLLVAAKVAANMVVPDGEGGGYLQEPFVGQLVIPSLYETYMLKVERARQFAERTSAQTAR